MTCNNEFIHSIFSIHDTSVVIHDVLMLVAETLGEKYILLSGLDTARYFKLWCPIASTTMTCLM